MRNTSAQTHDARDILHRSPRDTAHHLCRILSIEDDDFRRAPSRLALLISQAKTLTPEERDTLRHGLLTALEWQVIELTPGNQQALLTRLLALGRELGLTSRSDRLLSLSSQWIAHILELLHASVMRQDREVGIILINYLTESRTTLEESTLREAAESFGRGAEPALFASFFRTSPAGAVVWLSEMTDVERALVIVSTYLQTQERIAQSRDFLTVDQQIAILLGLEQVPPASRHALHGEFGKYIASSIEHEQLAGRTTEEIRPDDDTAENEGEPTPRPAASEMSRNAEAAVSELEDIIERRLKVLSPNEVQKHLESINNRHFDDYIRDTRVA